LAVTAGDAATIGRLEAALAAGAGWVSHLLQQIVLAMWNDAAVTRQLEGASTLYRERRSALCDELAARGIDVQAPTGLNVWVPVDDEATATSAMLASGWLVAPGGRFRIASAPAMRITTAALVVEQAAACAESIAAACASADSKGRRAGSAG
jgi:DNA-binding transcriptional MocR family regulator